MKLITLARLADAIEHRLGYDSKRARRVAEFLLDLFGYDDRIIDNILLPEERQLFYILQSVGIVSNGREETILYDGREWRTHYWRVNRERIVEFSKQCEIVDHAVIDDKADEPDFEESVYSRLTDEVWQARRVLGKKPSFYS